MSLSGAGVGLAAPLVAAGVGIAGAAVAGVAAAVAGVAAAPVFPLLPPFDPVDIHGLSFEGIPVPVAGVALLPGPLIGSHFPPSTKSLNSGSAKIECVNASLMYSSLPIIASVLSTPDPREPVSCNWIEDSTTMSAKDLRQVVIGQAGRPAIIMIPNIIAVVEDRKRELPFARDHRLTWGHQEHLSHHVLAVNFDVLGKILFTYVSFLAPNFSMWVPGDFEYLQESFESIRGHQWELPLEGNGGILFLKPGQNVTSSFERYSAASVPNLSKSFPVSVGLANSKYHLSVEGRYECNWNLPSDAPGRIHQAEWAPNFRSVSTQVFLQMLTDKNSVGLKDFETYWEKLKSQGNKSLAELKPHLTYLQGFTSSPIMRFIISQDNAAEFRSRFFKAEWNDLNMNLLSIVHFMPVGSSMNFSDHTHDLMNGLHNLDMFVVRAHGEHWANLFSDVARKIGTEDRFINDVPVHVMFYVIHLTLSQGFTHLKEDEKIFNWHSFGVLTIILYFKELFEFNLSVPEITKMCDKFDRLLSGKITWPFGAGRVVGGVDNLRSEPVIGANLFPVASIKRKVSALSDTVVPGPVVPVIVPLVGGPLPLVVNANQYCFHSIVSAFDLTTSVVCPPCADPTSSIRCIKGMHLSKDSLPAIDVVVGRLQGLKNKCARKIVTLLKAKKNT